MSFYSVVCSQISRITTLFDLHKTSTKVYVTLNVLYKEEKLGAMLEFNPTAKTQIIIMINHGKINQCDSIQCLFLLCIDVKRELNQKNGYQLLLIYDCPEKMRFFYKFIKHLMTKRPVPNQVEVLLFRIIVQVQDMSFF